MTPDFFYRPTPDQDPSSGYLVFNPSTAEDRCPGSERYVSIDSPRPSPDRSPCPECGKVISFHRVTGRFKHHNRSVTVPPSLPDLGPGSVIGIVGEDGCTVAYPVEEVLTFIGDDWSEERMARRTEDNLLHPDDAAPRVASRIGEVLVFMSGAAVGEKVTDEPWAQSIVPGAVVLRLGSPVTLDEPITEMRCPEDHYETAHGAGRPGNAGWCEGTVPLDVPEGGWRPA
jgi:hypothetical protein